MSDALYERYKDALRRGHVAALRGRPEEALGAYREAVALAPDRALPYASLAGVLAKSARYDEAVAAYDDALARAPRDEAALRGRADALVAAGRPVDAAETLDRLSRLLDEDGRLAEACDTAREALELAESRDRRTDVEAFARRLRSEGRDMESTLALGRALEVLREPASRPRTATTGGADVTAEGSDAQALGTSTPTAPSVRAPRSDREDLLVAAEAAIDGGDLDAVRSTALAASAAQRRDGLLEAALDTCYLALAIAPSDPAIHLALAGLYLDRGWRVSAVDKIILLGRLADLTDDEATHDRLAMLVAERLSDEPRLAARYG
jgi:tetratricopeptide (TPR) repeat protein